MDKTQVCITFTKTTDDGISYTDRIFYDQEEYDKLKEADIEAAKQERFDNWEAVRANPPEEVVKTEAEQIAEIDAMITSYTVQKQELEAKIVEKTATEPLKIVEK